MKVPIVAVLVPCYNEEATICRVVHDFSAQLPDADIYVYDNNSKDRTAELASEAGAIVRKEKKQGKGNVIRTMFREINADCYIILDGDDTYPAEIAPQMIREVLENNADMVIGDRLSSTYFVENKRPFHGFGNVLVRKLVNIIFRGNVKDIMTGYRAFSPLFVKTFPVLSKGFEIETEMTIHALDKNFNIAEIPVDYRDRPDGSVSKLSTFSDGTKVLLTILRLFKDYRPLPFFGLIALILALLSIGFFIPVFVEWLQTGLVLRIPTLVMCAIAMLTAMLSFSNGLILDTVIKKARMDFEAKMNMMNICLALLKGDPSNE